MPGVVAVWTADDLDVAPHHGFVKVHDDFARPPLATDRVRFVGEPVAVVFAETRRAGRRRRRRGLGRHRPAACRRRPEDALADGAPLLFDAGHGTTSPSPSRPDAPLDLEAMSDVVVPRPLRQPAHRRGADGAARLRRRPGPDGRLTFWASTQMPHGLHGQLAGVLGISTGRPCTSSRPRSAAASAARPASSRVHGGRGRRAAARPAGRLGADAHRGHAGAAAQPRAGPVRRARMPPRRHVHRRSACGSSATPAPTRPSARGCRAARGACRTAPTTSPRSTSTSPSPSPTPRRWAPTAAPAGPRPRPLLERLVDQAPHELGIDPIELRQPQPPRRRRVPVHHDHRQPPTTPGATASRSQPRPRRSATTSCAPSSSAAARAGDTIQLGIGVAAYVEITAGGGSASSARSRSHADGSATVYCRHVLARAGPPDRRTPCSSAPRPASRSIGSRSSTATPTASPSGGGTGGSRSLQLGGSAVHRATEAMVEQAKQLAADAARGRRRRHRRRHRGRARSASPAFRRRRSRGPSSPRAPAAPDGPLDGESVFSRRRRRRSRSAPTSPWSRSTPRPAGRGCVRHVAVDDCGTVLNPLLVEGQQHGGIGSGVGQALYEEIRYDATATRSRRTSPTTASRRRPSCRASSTHSTETPDAAQPAGRQGHRRGGDDRIDARRPERGDRRRRRTSACATSTCRARPSGCGRRSSRRATATPTHGANRRRSSPPCPRASRPTKRRLPQRTASAPARVPKRVQLLDRQRVGGEATPLGRLSGAEVNMKSYAPSAAQSSARSSRKNNSPSGRPSIGSSTVCANTSCTRRMSASASAATSGSRCEPRGQISTPGLSQPIAAMWRFHSVRHVSSPGCRPADRNVLRSPSHARLSASVVEVPRDPTEADQQHVALADLAALIGEAGPQLVGHHRVGLVVPDRTALGVTPAADVGQHAAGRRSRAAPSGRCRGARRRPRRSGRCPARRRAPRDGGCGGSRPTGLDDCVFQPSSTSSWLDAASPPVTVWVNPRARTAAGRAAPSSS